uniref:ENTH domain-containing protein n=1 Tax=Ditylenchus dipsaci TaxID=166011 RepID=A0A915E127_9BILA
MSISTLRRQVKNVAYNFRTLKSKCGKPQAMTRGAYHCLMSEIADLTHNPMSFTEIMSMLWKRLNDHGKNWRHVYKSLVLLDYLIKCGSEKVAQQCRENIYSIETLKRLSTHRRQPLRVRRSTSLQFGEEEMQLQIAMALSREECEKEEELRKGDAIRLQIALEESQREIASRAEANGHKMISSTALSQSALEDLLSMGLGEQTMGNGSSSSHLPSTSSQAFGGDSHQLIDPWSPRPSGSSSAATNGSHIYPALAAPASAPLTSSTASNDPWSPVGQPVHPLPSYAAATSAAHYHYSIFPRIFCCPVHQPTQLLHKNDPWAAFESQSSQQAAAVTTEQHKTASMANTLT